MKNIAISITILAFVAGGYFIFTNSQFTKNFLSPTYTSEVYTFGSADRQFTIQYSDDTEKALLNLDGDDYEMTQVRSASGAKYESADKSVVFWEHQGEATIEMDGDVLLENAQRIGVLKSNKQGDATSDADDPADNNDLDQDCDGFDEECTEPSSQSARPGDPIPGIDITVDQPGIIDDDSDGDGYGDSSETDRVIMEEGIKDELVSHEWIWRETVATNGTITAEPQNASAFALTFLDDGHFSATTDCNTLMGRYQLSDTSLSFEQIASTKKACVDDSQELQFTTMLEGVTTATLTDEGQTRLELHLLEDTMIFIAVPADIILTHDALIGMSEVEAVAYAEELSVPFRITKRDGEHLPTTLDYQPGRINAEVEDEIVVGYEIEI